MRDLIVPDYAIVAIGFRVFLPTKSQSRSAVPRLADIWFGSAEPAKFSSLVLLTPETHAMTVGERPRRF